MLSRNTLVAAVPALFNVIWACALLAGQDIEIVRPKKLVSPEEGAAIVRATLQHRAQLRNKPDCSHLVHDIYTETGLDYELSSSREMFEGIESFQRVRKPQPGDLIVWEGHVGIVIDPEDRSFYSSVNSGFSISSYVSAYWISRGVPRFYRYKINALQSARLLSGAKDYTGATAAAGTTSYTRATAFTRAPASARATASARPTAPTRTASRPTDYKESSTPGKALLASENELAADVEVPKNLVWGTEQEGRVKGFAVSEEGNPDLVVISTRRKPTKEEVRLRVTGFTESGTEELLQPGSRQRLIVIVDRFDVNRIETHGNFGWAELTMKEIGSFSDGRVRLGTRVEKVRFALEQQPEGWILFAHSDRIYLTGRRP